MNYLFDPTELHKFSGLTQDGQRDWRRRGFMDGIGQVQPNGRWKYSAPDVVKLALARLFVSRRLVADLNDAIRFGSYVAQFVWFRLEPDNARDKWQQKSKEVRFAAAFGALREGDEMQFEVYHDLASVFTLNLGAAVVVSCEVLTEELRPHLAGAVAAHMAARGAN
ncbi:hypothetical protein ASC97_01255 [Rhizobium sp. Root1203]|uniref:hypothetical protein n=1 Tax=Rhizobium sp. Root1203 TaxID=1736427 RepID=UPI0007093C7B|nr:hypothetical protein [Rhizobium sp. Root1203]KQV32253.1 hypothetical protein ASC97_01255 [Rhizobium sp. Root1203]